ncbi:MAG TPA: histidine kinase [Saprospiraceae bacterium]|nr:histidine kinase [Saprospiraceae bacterium]
MPAILPVLELMGLQWLKIQWLKQIAVWMLALTSIHTPLFAQPWYTLDPSNGLTETNNAFFTQTSGGHLWISSADGLHRFDGRQIRTFHLGAPGGVNDPIVSSEMYEDSRGMLWFTTAGGIHGMFPDGSGYQYLQLKKDGLGASFHYAFALQEDSILWVSADDLVYQCNVKNLTATPFYTIPGSRIYPIRNQQNLLTGLAVSHFNKGIDLWEFQSGSAPKKKSFFTSNTSTPEARIFHLLPDPSGQILWIPSSIGLIRFQLEDYTYKVLHPDAMYEPLTFCDAAKDMQGNIWLASVGKGVFRFSLTTQKFAAPITTVQSGAMGHDVSSINRIYTDPTGGVWLANWGRTVLHTHLSGTKFSTYLSGGAIPASSRIAGVCMRDSNQLLGAVAGAGAFVLDQTGQKKAEIKCEGLRQVLHDSGAGIWLMCNQELYLLTADVQKKIRAPIPALAMEQMVLLAPSRLLLVVQNGFYVVRFHRNSILATKCLYENIDPATIISLYAASDGTVFAGLSTNQLVRLRLQGHQVYADLIASGTGFINNMVEDPVSQKLWLASSNGLCCLAFDQQTNVYQWQAQIGGLAQSLQSIVLDRHNRIWVATSNEMIQIHPSGKILKRFTQSDGLHAAPFSLAVAAALPDGRLAFGGVNGLNVFHPDSIHDNPNPPRIHFTNWVVNDTGSISTAPEYLPHQTFSADQRTLSFYFVGIDFSAPDEVLYRYRLKGYDQDTVNGGNNGFARYAQLPAGTYTFQIWAANSDGVWSAEPHELSFTVLPPWYATWWAYTSYLLLGFSFAYWIYRIRVARIRKEEETRRKEAEFRQKEAEAKQLAAEWQNAVLRLQMNPHFLFNSMNSISSYLLQKDVDTAQDYLARFSKLMRRILELAAKPFIAIQDEVALLEQYMSVESMRFENAFHWTISIASDIDPDDVQVPTMILQPFVENAIWHGFSRQKSQGHIQIGFFMQNGMLCCTVEDNGTGRKTPQPDQEPRKVSAIQITRQRLAAFKPVEGQQPQLHFKDLLHPDGSVAGTKVEIWLPPDL